MKKVVPGIFDISKKSEKPLFIFEMANNHGGSITHGLKIIRDIHKVSRKFDFNYGFKFQFRDLKTFIHPHFKKRMDLKYIKRFSQTELSPLEFEKLIKEAEKLHFITVATPFDESSVDLCEKLNVDIIKIASCSFTDWPLLERVVKTDKPIIASTAGVFLSDIDKVVSFFQHREKKFALMHCVGEYPTEDNHLQLNQIDLFKNRYPDIIVGYSTHERPDNYEAVSIAIGKGARILEKHVAIESAAIDKNAYSATPDQIKNWLEKAQEALKMEGIFGRRAPSSEKEQADLLQFKRGAFAKTKIKRGERVDKNNIYFAFPAQKGQILANDISKYTYLFATKDIEENDPIVNVNRFDQRETILSIVNKVPQLLKKSQILLPTKAQFDLEISHHYGPDKFYTYGATLVTCVNRQYCKKLIIMFPGQMHPTQYHKKKEETFHILYGDFLVFLNGKKHLFHPGDIVTIEPLVKHSFMAPKGGILEEISSTHFIDDSFYEDKKIMENKFRKTFVTYWTG